MDELSAGILRWLALIGLMAAAGPALFDGWIARRPAAQPTWRRRSRRLVVAGGLLLAAATLVAAASKGWQVGQGRPEAVVQYLLRTRAGHASLAQTVAGLVAAGAAWVPYLWPARGPLPRLALLPGLVAVAALVGNSHAGVRGGEALIVDGLHVAAVALWIGGLLRFALVRPEEVPLDQWPGLMRRFSHLGALAVVAVAATGLWAARRNLYGLDALTRSPYGQALGVKLALVSVLLAVAAVNLFVLRPWLEGRWHSGQPGRSTGPAPFEPPVATPAAASSIAAPGPEPGQRLPLSRQVAGMPSSPESGRRLVRRLARWVRAEAGAALAVLLASGLLAVLPPADRPAALQQPASWQVQLAGEPVELAVEPRQRGAVILSVRSLGRLQLAKAHVDLDMPDHPMGRYVIPLQGRGDRMEAAASLPMPGRWRLTWTVEASGAAVEQFVTEFETTGAPGNQRTGRLSLRAAFQSTAGALQAGMALAGMVAAAALVVIGWRRLLWLPFAAGLVAMGFGAWLLGQVAWIDAYPTTFLPNPLPATPAVAERGRQVFMENCASCHGSRGRGDGPAAAGMLPPPADLTGLHTRQHTDGDLYWWITHGIDGTAMPAFQERLTEEERWAVIRFIRTLGDD